MNQPDRSAEARGHKWGYGLRRTPGRQWRRVETICRDGPDSLNTTSPLVLPSLAYGHDTTCNFWPPFMRWLGKHWLEWYFPNQCQDLFQSKLSDYRRNAHCFHCFLTTIFLVVVFFVWVDNDNQLCVFLSQKIQYPLFFRIKWRVFILLCLDFNDVFFLCGCESIFTFICFHVHRLREFSIENSFVHKWVFECIRMLFAEINVRLPTGGVATLQFWVTSGESEPPVGFLEEVQKEIIFFGKNKIYFRN